MDDMNRLLQQRIQEDVIDEYAEEDVTQTHHPNF